MKKIVTMSVLALFCVMMGVNHDAQAKRFGGGMSFGKSFSKPHAAPSSRQGLSQKQNVANKASPARGGMMGMLGGLAMGGLLGALFFGGAFDGINFMDILLLGGIAFAIFWFVRKKAAAAAPKDNYAYAGQQQNQPDSSILQEDTFTSSESTPPTSSMVRPDVDENFFIPAAKDIFMRMQTSWDNKDMDNIRTFCTPEIASRIELDIHALGDTQTKTEVAMLNAEILDTWVESDYEWVAVKFSALLKEDTLASTGEILESDSNNLDETWIFRHPQQSDDPTWYLSGIQQASE
ncbi:MAG: Tim44-like domain-containing protein [Mariprofundaceae bacterium]|nr:Tim44-like domain-containing protein [Mariprofundaceae bacterium]